MKKITFLGCVLVCLCMGIHATNAQNSQIVGAKIKKRTLLTKFESDYVLSVSERIALKQSRIAHQYRTKELLDTLDISDRKRRRLIKELKLNPFSNRIQDIIAEKTALEDTLKNPKSN